MEAVKDTKSAVIIEGLCGECANGREMFAVLLVADARLAKPLLNEAG